MLDRICWPYLAGFLDGDGWITEAHYRHKSGRPFTTWTIGFTQVCEQVMVMEAIYAFLSSHSVRCTIVRRGKNMKSSRGMVNVLIKHQPSACLLLRQLEPFLLVKQAKALACLEDLEARVAARQNRQTCRVRPQGKRFWTEAELDIARVMADQGRPYPEIANRLNRTVNSVAQQLSRLGLSNGVCKPWACHGDVLADVVDRLNGR